KGENYGEELSQCSPAVLKADPSVEKQITELASSSVVDMESMRRLVDFLCSSEVDAHLVSLAHCRFLEQWNASLIANRQDCIKRSGLLDDIRYYKSAGLTASIIDFWHKYDSGFYGPYQVSCDVRDDVEDMY
ncbi:MAG: hypothetical protein LBO73_01895, partial [Holosporaceae bacterium]|nr:hypothetical protein [Holosporaceae bacterium]